MSDATQPAPTGPDVDIVAEGVAALRLFGGDLDLMSATRLLSMWSYNNRLSAAERSAILRHFEQPRCESPAFSPARDTGDTFRWTCACGFVKVVPQGATVGASWITNHPRGGAR